MNWIDILILAILAFSLFDGFKNGLIIEIAQLVALVLGIFGALKFSDYTAQKLEEVFNLTSSHMGLISFIVTFIVIVVLVHLMAQVIDKIFKMAAMGMIIRITGAFFSVIKTTLILSVVFVVLNTINSTKNFLPQEKMDESRLYYPISDIAPAFFPMLEDGNLFRRFENLRERNEPEPETV